MTQRIQTSCAPKKEFPMRLLSYTSLLATAFVGLSVAGCGSSAMPNGGDGGPLAALKHASAPASLPKEPIVVTFDTQSKGLAYWPIKQGGGQHYQSLSGSLGINNVYALAANGNVVIIANYDPAEIVTYDVKSQVEKTMADPYGGPVDVAVAKGGSIYALNLANVAVYKNGSSNASELSCGYINLGEAIAIDNEGNVYVDGYGPQNFMGVVEYPAGSTSCVKLHLRKQLGYIGGVGVDPRTDDLIVVDDPDLCAGGLEGRMIIYPRPFLQRTSVRRVLGATYCAGTFRLDARSKEILYDDATVSAGFPLIDQARFPSGKSEGLYEEGYYSNGNFAGFTTIPNVLPN